MLSLSARASRGPHEGSPFLLAFGDSLTAGYGLAASEAFPARLETPFIGRGR